MRSLDNIDITGKRCVIRQDLNVPMQDGRISNYKRLHAAVPTLRNALERRAGIILLSHFGRPEEGKIDPALSLKPVARALSECLDYPVQFASDYLDGVDCEPGDIVLCENVRFNKGETANDVNLAKQYAKLGDIFVMDAFGTAHRAHASTVGVAQFAKQACAGPLLNSELTALGQACQNPTRPVLAIVGGAKVSTKMNVLKGLLDFVDQLILGGGLANTLLASQNIPVGLSLYESALIADVQALLQQAIKQGKIIFQPDDVLVATEFSATAKATLRSAGAVLENEMILDIGPKTIAAYETAIANAGTVIWNGPLGVFEFPAFQTGTQKISAAIAKAPGFTLAGGGETLAAIDQFIQSSDLDYVSTGGGAFLEYLEKKPLPGVEILKQRAKETV